MNATFSRKEVTLHDLRAAAHRALGQPGWRFGHQTARLLEDGDLALEVLLLDTHAGRGEILSAHLPGDATEYPSLTTQIPAAHWAERAIGDFFGVRAEGHPRWKSLILHEAWPADIVPLRAMGQGSRVEGQRSRIKGQESGDAEEAAERDPRPSTLDPRPSTLDPRRYAFLEVHGDGVHEIPVGPIHAGIIEPGHFRFSCLGEVITNLEIRLGYQHRGVEQQLAGMPWRQARFVAEAASSDTAVGNALAHAVALEQLLGVAAPPRAEALRTLALEVERLANHVGDLGALSGDIGYSAGAAIFARLRGAVLGLGEMLAGSRLLRGFVAPGGVTRDLTEERRAGLARALAEVDAQVRARITLVMEHTAVIERMEGTGRLSPSLAREFGLVGPAARASGSDYDARSVFPHGLYPGRAPVPARRETGDVLARAQVRAEEIGTSLELLKETLETLPASPVRVLLDGPLPAEAVGVGIVEAWRGELIHWVTTDRRGGIQRYAIKDPSFNNWTGLAICVRGNLVADFPLCNKSFNLSYSGNDL